MNYQFISGIYKITCLANNKIYIGSAVSLGSRKANHFKTLRDNCHRNVLLQRAYNKYGRNEFLFEVLEICDKNILILREQFYMDSLRPQFNIVKIAGSSAGRKVKKGTIDKLIKAFKLKRDTVAPKIIELYRQNVPKYKIAKMFKTTSWRINKMLLDSGVENKKPSYYHKIKVFQYDLDLVLIKEWDCVKDAAQALKIDNSAICKCAKNKQKQYKNYIWKYQKINQTSTFLAS